MQHASSFKLPLLPLSDTDEVLIAETTRMALNIKPQLRNIFSLLSMGFMSSDRCAYRQFVYVIRLVVSWHGPQI